MDDDPEGILSNIRAVITSCKGAVTVRNLMRDYETLVGDHIPYQKLNYPNIESFLQSLPSLRVFGSGRDMMVEAVADSSSSHISSLISKQKPAKKKDYGLPLQRGYSASRPYQRFRGRGLRHSAPSFRNNFEREESRDHHYREQQEKTAPRFQNNFEREEARDYRYRDKQEKTAPRFQNNFEREESRDYHYREQQERIAPRFQNSFQREDSRDNYRGQPDRMVVSRSQNSLERKVFRDHYYREQPETMEPPIRVTVEGNARQVLMGVDAYSENRSHSPHTMDTRPKQDIPPRFQRANKIPGQSHHTTPQSPYNHELSKKKENPPSFDYLNNGEPDQLSSSSIISPLGPGQLVAAGRVQKLAADANFFLDTSSSDNEVHITGHSADVPQESESDLVARINMALNIEHSCDVDANLSSQLEPRMEYIPVPAPDRYNIAANMDLLERYTTARNWAKPVYITIRRKPIGEKAVYGSKVKIMLPNQIVKEYSGLPNEHENEKVAKCFAAIKALQELAAEEKVKLYQTVISTDKKLIFERICEIVGDSPAGMFAKTVEDQYSEKYLENLPKDWIELLSTCNNLSVEPSINNFIIVQRKVDPVSEPQIVPEKINLEDLPEQPAVYISHMNSTCDLWARIVLDGGDAYFDLITEMTHYYNNEGTKESVSEIQVGQYYAANTLMSWIRVCVTEVKHDERIVIAWLIDHGTSESFAFGSICKLLPQYCTLPIQAVNITLDGLEYFGDDLFASEVLNNCEYIIDEVLVGVITNIDTKSENLKMILFNTSDTKNDVNVNEILLDRICIKCAPQLINGCAMKVYISSISQKGEIYIQIPGEASERIEKVINSLSPEEISKHRVTSYQQVVTNKIFLAKYHDERWYRAMVTAPPSMQHPMVNVHFIDYGNAESVNISDIAQIEALPRIVEKLPAQALQVAMHSLPIDTLTYEEIDKLHLMLVGEEKTVLIKTVSVEEEPPVVELYYKTDNDSALVSVNNTIIVERLFKSDEKNESQSPCVQNGVNGVSSGGLKCPDLDGECIPVCITLAANPGNFIFQPMTYFSELESLMLNMYQYYATTLPEVPISDVVEGQLFAALHEDRRWYRVVVTGSIENNIFVRHCDFGDVTCVHVANLRELTEDFKKLPFMAIKGKLAGTDPLHTDWSVEDCLRFQTLVLYKQLNSVVHFIKNVVDPMDTVVELHLIDTEGEQEQNIRDILVSENRAKAKE